MGGKKTKTREPQTLKFFSVHQKRNIFLLLLLTNWHVILSRQCRSPSFLFSTSQLSIFTACIPQRSESLSETVLTVQLSKTAVHQCSLDFDC